MSLILDEHSVYIRDEVRLRAFDQAIRQTVRPGDVVVDLASGTGILGLMALRAGAARLYSIEETEIAGLSARIYAANGFGDRVRMVKRHSQDAHLPELADVVVADQIGNFGFNAGVVEYFSDARKRLLKPEGRLIPRGFSIALWPCESANLQSRVTCWDERPAGFDFSPASVIARNTGFQAEQEPDSFLGPARTLTHFDLSQDTPSCMEAEVELTVERPGTMHGLGGGFVADLAAGVSMTNIPSSTEYVNRRTVFLPLTPFAVQPGDRVRAKLRMIATQNVVSWTVQRPGESRGETRSTWGGMLTSPETLARVQPDYIPDLSPRGEARLEVLRRCADKAPVGRIESDLLARFPELFRSPAEAQVFVAEVVTRYC